MPERYRDAYPYPTRGERQNIELRRQLDDDLWEYMAENPMANDNPPAKPLVVKHNHQLCGHDCLSGSCSGLEAICISCEFRLQDSRGHDSPFRKPNGQG